VRAEAAATAEKLSSATAAAAEAAQQREAVQTELDRVRPIDMDRPLPRSAL